MYRKWLYFPYRVSLHVLTIYFNIICFIFMDLDKFVQLFFNKQKQEHLETFIHPG